MNGRIGILVAQLGTPDAPTTAAVRRYLAEFLSDRRVVDLNPVLWWVILHGIVLRTRPAKSAALYRKVWTDSGSPLLVTTQAQAAGLQSVLNAKSGAEIRVEVAMRYGNPSTASAIQKLCDWGAERILLFPMYPQYSAATIGSTCDAVFQGLSDRRFVPALRVVPHFYDHPSYIGALAESVRDALRRLESPPDKIVVSFHGIPQRYARLGDPYPKHCEATMRALAAAMGWGPDDYVMTYQSRFGREPWLQPYTDQTLMSLGRKGIRSIVALCPGFIADCLETIDEIGNLGREQFQSGGGESLHLVPCLNDRPQWIEAMTEIAWTELQGWM
ncbi:MAG TPA: ferrochelatase [Thermoanaerobaculia bacterium]|nr:ferrochelatase [Thermoanaerobaculia bacterium]